MKNSKFQMTNPHAGQPVLTAGAPIGEGTAAVIMVHGRGATPQDILALARVLDRPALTYLAPAAADQTWYPYSFLSEISRNEPHLSSALSVLGHLVTELTTRGIGREQIVLLGFSQGACLCSEFVARHAGRYGGVIAFSGGLIGPPGTQWNYPGSFDSTPAFFGCSDVHAHIPAARVDESAEVFSGMGAEVTKRLYPGMGHTVNADEIEEARKILDGLTSSGDASRRRPGQEPRRPDASPRRPRAWFICRTTVGSPGRRSTAPDDGRQRWTTRDSARTTREAPYPRSFLQFAMHFSARRSCSSAGPCSSGALAATASAPINSRVLRTNRRKH